MDKVRKGCARFVSESLLPRLIISGTADGSDTPYPRRLLQLLLARLGRSVTHPSGVAHTVCLTSKIAIRLGR